MLATWIGKRDYTPTSSSVTCNALFKEIMTLMLDGEEVVEFPKVEDPVYTKKKEKIKDQTEDEKLADAPNVVGMSLQEAKAALSQYNLTIYYIYSATVPSGTVISQSVQNGRIVLNVSKGSAPS